MNNGTRSRSSTNENSKNASVNETIKFPAFFSHILSPSLERIDPVRVLGRRVKIDLAEKNGDVKTAYYYIRKDNFVLGGLWGLLSGYCSRSFFKPMAVVRSGSIVQNPTVPPHFLERTAVIAGRVVRRICLAGLLFDFVEKQGAERYNASRTNTMTIFGALVACALAFRLCASPRGNLVYTNAIFGGYLIGAKLPTLIMDPTKRGRARARAKEGSCS